MNELRELFKILSVVKFDKLKSSSCQCQYVNAERALKLATDFNLALTHDEEQRELIFEVLENHRQNIALPLKRNFADNEWVIKQKSFKKL